MKLTNAMRDAFIAAVMQDVPKKDYQEQIRALVAKKVQAIQDKHFKGVDSDRLAYNTIRIYKASVTVVAHGILGDEETQIANAADVTKLVQLHDEQAEKLNELRAKIRGAIYACTTRKQAVEVLPEFEKYLPPDEAKALRTLPALANVAADFVKAGWPKKAAKQAIPA